MIKFKIVNGFTSGICSKRPGGYLDFHQNNLLILSARGSWGIPQMFTKNLNLNKLKII